MSNYRSLDLDAARAEQEVPDGIEVTNRGETFILPAELPADVFDPFFTDEFDLPAIMARLMQADDDTSTLQVIGQLIFDQPAMPRQTINAVKQAIGSLFGAEQMARFEATRPSIKDYVRLGKGLFDLYGTSLGEAFASAGSSENAGPTSKPTSPATTPESTPDASGDAPEPAPASSE